MIWLRWPRASSDCQRIVPQWIWLGFRLKKKEKSFRFFVLAKKDSIQVNIYPAFDIFSIVVCISHVYFGV